MTAIEARELVCGRAGQPVVRLSLSVEPGELSLLTGANGAGKTTVLLTLAGVLAPLAGTVRLHGRETRAPLHARTRDGLALVLPDRGVFATMTVRDNLRLGRGSVSDATTRFPELLELLSARAGTLSGGEQQLLRLARALAGRPRLLLVDELAMGLAPPVLGRVLAALRQAADDGGAVLAVQPRSSSASLLADRSWTIANGRCSPTPLEEALCA